MQADVYCMRFMCCMFCIAVYYSLSRMPGKLGHVQLWPPIRRTVYQRSSGVPVFLANSHGILYNKKNYEKVWIYASLVALHTPRSTSLHRKLVRGRLVSELVVEVVRATAGLAMAKKEKKGRNGTNILKCNTLDSPTHQRVLMCQCICTFKLHTRDESPIP